ncbi:MAG: PD-(D/E)XK nuclease family protein [Methanomassiliicoccales archaeon]|nr:MAG: PD-(D/E)XK nuclease family protein [Methanomassiliicoccales archaeon]
MRNVELIMAEPQDRIERVENELKEALRRDPFGAMMILPSPTACEQVIERILDDGITVLGEPVCTLDQLAKGIFRTCAEKEVEITRQQSELILRNVMEEHRAEVPDFHPLWGNLAPTVAELRALFDTWREFLVGIDRIKGDARRQQLKAIYLSYLRKLDENGFCDDIRIKEMAVRWLEQGKVKVPGTIWMLGLNELCPLDRMLAKALMERTERAVFIARRDRGRVFNEYLAWTFAGKIEIDNLAPIEKADLSERGVKVRAQVFVDPLAEARAVASEIRSLIEGGAPPGSICVMMPMRQKTAERYRQAFEDCGVWCNLDVPTDLMRSSVVQTLLRIFDAVVEDMPREHIVRLLSSPYVRWYYQQDGERKVLGGGMVGRYAHEAGVIGGPEDWREKLDALRIRTIEEASAPDVPVPKREWMLAKAERISCISEGLQALFTRLRSIDGVMDAEERLVRIKALLKELEADRHLEFEDERIYTLEARSLSAFFDILDELVATERLLPSGGETFSSYVQRVRLMCSSCSRSLEPKYEDAVMVTGIRSSVMSRYDHVFIIGMVDGDIPFLGAGNPFITERDIEELYLLTRWDMFKQEKMYLYSAIMCARKGLWLSSHATEDGEKVVTSSFFDELLRAQRTEPFMNAEPTYSLAHQSTLLGRAVAGDGPWEGLLRPPFLDLDDILMRINVERCHRSGDYDSEYDGVLKDESILSDLGRSLGPDRIFSVTDLEMYAACPYRYYLSRVLSIEPKEEVEMEISPKDQGTFVHSLAFRLFRKMKEDGITRVTSTNIEDIERMARALAEEEMSRFPFSGPAFDAYKARMLGSEHRKGLLRAFLEKEADNVSGFIPSYFELSFGRRLPEECDPMSSEEPVSVRLSPDESILLAGRVDRIDVKGDRFLIIDYKTGMCPSQKDVREGRNLQVQLYLQAVQQILKGRKGLGGIYYQVKSEKDLGFGTLVLDGAIGEDLMPLLSKRKLFDSMDSLLDESNAKVVSILHAMRAGRFHPALDQRDCSSYCDYASICRFDAHRTLDMEGD